MKLFIFVILFFSFLKANALISERNFQASEGQTYLEDGLTFELNSIDIDDGGVDPSAGIDFDDFRINLYVEHGFSENLSGYAGVGYGFGKIEVSSLFAGSSKTDARGLDPVNLGIKYQRLNSKGRFFSRVNLGYGLEESKVDSDGDVNRTSQVLTLNLKLGYEVFLSESTLMGGSFLFTLVSTDAKSEDDADEKTDGNLGFSFYYESHKMNGLVLGGHFDYLKAGFTSSFGYYSEDLDFGIVELGGYFRAPLNERLFILGGLDYGFSISEPGAGIDELSRIRFNVGSRLLF